MRILGLGWKDIAVVTTVAIMASGCLNNGSSMITDNPLNGNGSSNAVNSTTSGPNGTPSNETQCTIFSSNAKEYSTCISCKNTLCSNCLVAGQCTNDELASCIVGSQSLIQCVHDNTSVTPGSCVGLKCGDGQVADFASCSCKDISPPISYVPQPGQDDTTTPYLEPGFFISNFYCPLAQLIANSLNGAFQPADCLAAGGTAPGGGAFGIANAYSTLNSNYLGTPPRVVSGAPANVYADVGYIRWDLAMDASQYSPALPFLFKQNFTNTWSTIPVNMSVYYQLKPNTALASTLFKWNDCVEHFSGYDNYDSSNIYLTTNNVCDERTATSPYVGANAPSAQAPTAIGVNPSNLSKYAGTAQVSNISLNGSAANDNLITPNAPAPIIDLATSMGTSKIDNGAKSAANPFDQGVGMLSNIGTYKYSWTDIRVKNPFSGSDIAKGSVSGRISINMNLGYTPASAVESSAMSTEAATNTVSTIDCSTSTNSPHPCVATAVYRTSGGGILSQSFSPRFGNNHSSVVNALPAGITAVSTPKIIEDISQWDRLIGKATNSTNLADIATQSGKAARLRVFARAADGNIYMSRFSDNAWGSWMSLGRPWTCRSASSTSVPLGGGAPASNACQALISPPPGQQALPLVYAPFTTNDANPAIYTGFSNDGISIAGEPVVASYMHPGGKSGIAIVVRVSQLNSHDGKAGPLHNAIFYTFNVTSGNAATLNGKLDFDDPYKWSPWLLAGNANATDGPLAIQGNPLAILRPNCQGAAACGNATVMASKDLRLYVLGTDGRDDSNAVNLHPPIAPKYGQKQKAWGSPFGNANDKYWYGYGHQIVRSSIVLNSAAMLGGWNGPGTSWTAHPLISAGAVPSWNTFERDDLTALTSSPTAIVSDWSAVPTSSSTGSLTAPLDTNKFRALASEIVGMYCSYLDFPPGHANSAAPSYTCDAGKSCLGTAPVPTNGASSKGVGQLAIIDNLGVGNNVAPCRYIRRTRWMSYAFDNASPSGISKNCLGHYDEARFQGGVQAINLSNAVMPDGNGNPTPSGGETDLSGNGNSMVLMGRALCPDNNRCDAVSPTIAYASVSDSNAGANECTAAANPANDPAPDHVMYYAGEAIKYDSASKDSTALANSNNIQGYGATSDVVVVRSHALGAANYHIPFYFISRGNTGNIVHGFWGRSGPQNQTIGSLFFSIFQSGGFTN